MHKRRRFVEGVKDRRFDLNDVLKGVSLDTILEDLERAYIMKALEFSGGNKNKAAELLGIRYHAMWHRLNKLGIETKSEK